MSDIDNRRYSTDDTYRRTVDRERAWQKIAQQFDAMAYRMRVRAWLTGSQVGDTGESGRYVVTYRALGVLSVQTQSGDNRGACSLFAPVPLA